ncbi:MAG: glycine zipper family protein [Lactobacillaceae bacterium]|jgi:hypothetical protein|nr:glycine zipper family protein [Lactobacillaceae bacterium]
MELKLVKHLTMLCAGILVCSVMTPFTLIGHADDQVQQQLEVHENSDWKAMENEINSPQFQLAIHGEKSKEVCQSLLTEYDGAERDIIFVGAGTGWTEKIVNGGDNTYATTKAGLANLRDSWGLSAVAMIGAGGGAGTAIAGIPGAIIGGLIGNALSGYCKDAQNDMKKWIDVGSTKGGARVTLTAEFPIDSVDTTTQCKVRKI